MEAAWVDESPAAKFWSRLHNEVVDKLVSDPDQFLLRHMRFDHDMVREYQKRFGHIFTERGLNLYELIAKACGEVWDNEDEEKGGHMKKVAPMDVKENPNAICVDHPRQIGLREREGQGHVVQGRDDRREEDLQEEGRGRRFFGGGSPQKAPP